MEITISKRVTVKETVNVELPYYYRHDLSGDWKEHVIYGKIAQDCCTSIVEINNSSGEIEYQISKSEIKDNDYSEYSDYFWKQHSSDVDEYEEVKEKCQLFLNDL